ncbi:hypothetical protein GCM10012286_06130 [Streptomyces lasiicapitis]|uniref:Uncharacterized protein n=1 Tax=Streptomyces lasiicapitis TaxID=1923961 RepID=A0ABQ2LIK2_9ACTN|nr:hypothetical protein GCM10012286_06130 [Streptomyces lasiicapitis]
MACGVIAALCGVLLVARPWAFTARRVWLTSVACTLVCLVAMIVCWSAILRDEGRGRTTGSIVRDERSARGYLSRAMPAGRDPTVIPTGVYVESIEFTTSNNVVVSGYVWQRYPPNTPKDLTRGVVFPEADESHLEDRDIAYERTAADGTKTTGWYFNATFRQRFDYRTYPLDRQNVWLRMWQPDFDKDAVLVPDFSSYPPWLDKDLLGTDPQLVSGEWRPMYTAYSYARYVYPSSFGLKPYDGPVNYPDLYFNMVYERDYTGAVVGNLVPVALIALVVFASLFVTSRDQKFELFGSNTFAVMAFLVTMLLVVVVDHNEIRSVSADGSVMYMEYVFFGLYLLLLLVTANGVLIALDRPGEILTKQGNLPAKALYWPLLVGIVLVATISVFFGVGW